MESIGRESLTFLVAGTAGSIGLAGSSAFGFALQTESVDIHLGKANRIRGHLHPGDMLV